MREISQHILLRPVGAPVTDAFSVMADRPFALDLVSDVDDGGVYYKCDKQVVIDTPDAVTLRFFSIERACQVEMRDTGGRRYVMGYAGMPVRVRISEGVQTSTLFMAGEMPWNPLA